MCLGPRAGGQPSPPRSQFKKWQRCHARWLQAACRSAPAAQPACSSPPPSLVHRLLCAVHRTAMFPLRAEPALSLPSSQGAAPAGPPPPGAAAPRGSTTSHAARSQACEAGPGAWTAARRFLQKQQPQQRPHAGSRKPLQAPAGATDLPRPGSPVDSWLAGWQRLAEEQGCAASLLDTSTAQDLLRRAAGTLPRVGATPPLAAGATHTPLPRSPAPSAVSTEDSRQNSSGDDRCARSCVIMVQRMQGLR